MDNPLHDYIVPFLAGVGESTLWFASSVAVVGIAALAIVVLPMLLGLVVLIAAYAVVAAVLYGIADATPIVARHWADVTREKVEAFRD